MKEEEDELSQATVVLCVCAEHTEFLPRTPHKCCESDTASASQRPTTDSPVALSCLLLASPLLHAVNIQWNMSKFELIRQLRQRHEDIRESVDKTMNELNSLIDSREPDHPGNWYLEKLVNVLRVQQKLLDNRMTAAVGSMNDNTTDLVHKDMDRVEQLISEIRTKASV